MKEVSIPIPPQIGPYRVVRPLAQGGMAAVFEVEDPSTHEHLALKLLTHRGVAMPRFSREYKALTRLDHPNIVRVYAYGAHEGLPFVTMELLDGVPVQVYAKSCGRPGDPHRVAEAVRIVAAIADALDYLHSRGIVHRDLKSANVLVLADGRVKLLDFGTARLAGAVEQITRAGEFVGTFAYAAPEQIRGDEVDHRSDIYSLGVLFYRLCTGRLLFEAPTPQELARMHLEKVPIRPRVLVPGLSQPIEDLILAMVAKDPADRPATARAVVERLRGDQAAEVGERIAVVPPRRLIGRQAELEGIRATLAKARPGRMVLITGPPGAGRHRLLKATVAEARGLGWRVFGGTWSEQPGLGVLLDVAEAAWSSLPHHDSAELTPAMERLRAADRGQRSHDAEPLSPARAAELPEDLAAVLGCRAGHDGAPLVLSLAQIHRAAPMALDALVRLRQIAREGELRLLFVGTATDDADVPGGALRQRLPDAWRVLLRPLSVEEVGELAQLMLGGTLASAELGRALHGVTGGLPGFVEEVLRAMVQSGHLAPLRSGSTLTWIDRTDGRIAIPGSAREAINMRIEGVPAKGQRALEALAAAGGEAPIGLLAHALECSEDEAGEVLDELRSRRLTVLQEEGGEEIWAFRLGMTADVVRERTRPSRRYVLRKLLAEGMAGRPPSPARVGILAAAGQIDEAIHDALAWGEPNLDAGRAREVLPVLLLVEPARASPGEATARFYLLLARCLSEVRPASEAVEEAFGRAFSLSEGLPVRGEVELHHARLLVLRGDLDGARVRLSRAFAMASAGSSDALRARVSRDIGALEWYAGRLDQARAWFDEALEASRRTGEEREVARVQISRAVCSLELGKLREADRGLRDAAQRYEHLGERHGVWLATANLSESLRMQGRLSEAIEMLEPELRAARESGTRLRFAHMSLCVAEAEIELLRLGRARERLATLTAELDPRQHLHMCAAVALAQGRLAMVSGEAGRAVEVLRPAFERSEQAGLGVIAPRLNAALGEALVGVGREADGLERLRLARAELERSTNLPALAEACAARARAVKGREDADILFMPVLRWLEEEPALLLRMEHLLAALRFARERGRPEQARVYAQAANALLTVLRGQLSPADQEALQIHGRTAEISEGLELE